MAVRGYKDAGGRQRYAVEFQQGQTRVHRRAPPGVTYAQAKDWETQLRRAIFDTGTLGRRADVPLSDVIQAWLETKPQKHLRDLTNKANALAPFVEGKVLQQAPEVAAAAVKAWRESLLSATVNRRLCVLKAACKWAWKQGLIEENLSGKISQLPENNRREIYLTKAQVAAVVRAAESSELRSAIMIGAYAGLRPAEIVSLQEKSARNGSLIVQGKGDKTRTVPVPAPLRPFLRELPLRLSYWQLHAGFTAARDRAGLPPTVTPHTLRHTCASWLINAGVDLYTVGAILGHSGPATTARYAHLAQKTLKQAMGKLR